MKLFSIKSISLYFTLLIFLCLQGCHSNLAPVDDINRPPPKLSGTHTVKPDETLYSISWRYSRDYKDLAAVNHIAEPYAIQPGQVLSLAPAPKQTKLVVTTVTPELEPNRAATPRKESQQSVAKKNTANAVPQKNKNIAANFDQKIIWRWPAEGKVQGYFGQTKGLNIVGKKSSPIYAAARGRIVYSGSGLRGYGKLLIIKHNDRLLSAYAHNEVLYAKEGDWVEVGQKIASMGQSDSNTVQLHFEIRQDGKPVDPLKYLPRK